MDCWVSQAVDGAGLENRLAKASAGSNPAPSGFISNLSGIFSAVLGLHASDTSVESESSDDTVF